MTETVTWLHISDTHFCKEKHIWDSKEVLDCFFDDLERMKNDYDLHPDLIIFTGDVAFGQIDNSKGLSLKSQYEEAKEFLGKILNIFPKVDVLNIFIVPGNHDVDRTLISDDQIEWLENLRKNKEKNGSQIINELIKSNRLQWKRYMERLKDYKDFLADCGYQHLLEDPDRLIYSAKRNINGFEVGIAGLNSAWSSCGDEDKAKLWLGTYQISEARNNLKDCMLSIVLSHHPPNWFTDLEDRNINIKIESSFGFYLHGHEHEEWVTPSNKHFRIASGALYSGCGQKHGYNFGRLYPFENRGEIFFRTYSINKWIPNIIGDKTNNEGIYKLENLNSISIPKITTASYKETKTSSLPSHSLVKKIDISMQVPQTKNFVGRNLELSNLHNLLEKNIIIIEGIAGIGKTYLASKFAEQIKEEYKIYWYENLNEFTVVKSVITQISLFLKENGNPTLYNSIDLGYETDILIEILKSELKANKIAIFLITIKKLKEMNLTIY